MPLGVARATITHLVEAPAGTQLDFSDLGTVLGHWGPESLVTYHAAPNGTRVQQWNDLSGNNRHLIQNTAANAPRRDRTIGGFQALDFIAANSERLSVAGLTSTIPGAVLAVIITDVNTTSFIMGTGAQADTNNGWNLTHITTPNLRCRISDGTLNSSNNVSCPAAGNAFVAGGRWLNGTQVSRANDSLSATGTAALGAIGSDPFFMNSFSGSLYWDGAVAECVVFSSNIGATNFQTGADRLKTKYGFSY